MGEDLEGKEGWSSVPVSINFCDTHSPTLCLEPGGSPILLRPRGVAATSLSSSHLSFPGCPFLHGTLSPASAGTGLNSPYQLHVLLISFAMP
jgi:hypothetical protein